MQDNTARVEAAVETALTKIREWEDSTAPNSPEAAAYRDATEALLRDFASRIRSVRKVELIGYVSRLIDEVSLPSFDYDIADRETIVGRAKLADVVASLSALNRVARSCGFYDPDQLSVTASDAQSAELLADIKRQLDETSTIVGKLEKDMASSPKQIGVTVGTGVISIDIGTLIHGIKKVAKATKDRVDSGDAINVAALRTELAKLSADARTLLDNLQSIGNAIKSRTLDLAARLVSSTANAFRSGLKLIKREVERASGRLSSPDRVFPSFSKFAPGSAEARLLTELFTEFQVGLNRFSEPFDNIKAARIEIEFGRGAAIQRIVVMHPRHGELFEVRPSNIVGREMTNQIALQAWNTAIGYDRARRGIKD